MKKLPGEKTAPVGILTVPLFKGDGKVRQCIVCGDPADELYIDLSVAAGEERKLGIHDKCSLRYLATVKSGGRAKPAKKVSMGGSPK